MAISIDRAMPDAELVELLREGHEGAFRVLFERYSKRIFYFALRYLRSRDEAEGLVQDVFAKVWSGREMLRSDASLEAYLFAAARNTLYNAHRKRLNEQAYMDDLAHHMSAHDRGTEHEVLYNNLKDLLDEAVAALPEKRREVWTLHREQHLSYADIAAMMRVSVKTVESHMRLALQAVRQHVDTHWLVALWWLVQFFGLFIALSFSHLW